MQAIRSAPSPFTATLLFECRSVALSLFMSDSGVSVVTNFAPISIAFVQPGGGRLYGYQNPISCNTPDEDLLLVNARRNSVKNASQPKLVVDGLAFAEAPRWHLSLIHISEPTRL